MIIITCTMKIHVVATWQQFSFHGDDGGCYVSSEDGGVKNCE